jgi:hypothetical protein
MPPSPFETIEFLPLVKAYPALSRKYGEVSCVAGVLMSGPGSPAWIRIYPVPFRSLSDDRQFAKYQPIRVRVQAHSGDRRPETRRPDRDSIEIAGPPVASANGWARRRRFVEPLIAPSMCEILRRQQVDGTSLGAIRPREVLDIEIEPADVAAGKRDIAQAWAAQASLLDEIPSDERTHQVRELEQMPWTFKYHYRCSDPHCRTHHQSIIDWEISRFYHRIRHQADWRERLKARWIGELCAPERDTAFFVGNQHQHPNAFLVLGVWWPPVEAEQLALTLGG